MYIEAVLSQYINDQQQVSNLTLLWDGGGPDYLTEEILHEVKEGFCRLIEYSSRLVLEARKLLVFIVSACQGKMSPVLSCDSVLQ